MQPAYKSKTRCRVVFVWREMGVLYAPDVRAKFVRSAGELTYLVVSLPIVLYVDALRLR